MNNLPSTTAQPMPTLIEETDPVKVLEDATTVANILSDIIEKQQLYALYKGGKKHVVVEGWTTLGSLVKVFAELQYSKRLDRPDEIVYEAKAVAKTFNGVIIGTAEALCSDKETLKTRDGRIFKRWEDEHAVKSMAQTRAISKCLRFPLGWIMSLAGYEATPSEEMPTDLEDQPITQPDGSQILPPKTKKSNFKEKKGGKPTGQKKSKKVVEVPKEALKEIFKLSPELKEKFEPVMDGGDPIPHIAVLREADKLYAKEDNDLFKEIKAILEEAK